MSKKAKTIHSAVTRAHEDYTDCIIEAEQKCMGRVLCYGCGAKLKVFAGPGHKLSAKPPQKKLSPADDGRRRAMCADPAPLSKRDKKEMLRIASVLGIKGVSQRSTKKEICAKIREITG